MPKQSISLARRIFLRVAGNHETCSWYYTADACHQPYKHNVHIAAIAEYDPRRVTELTLAGIRTLMQESLNAYEDKDIFEALDHCTISQHNDFWSKELSLNDIVRGVNRLHSRHLETNTIVMHHRRYKELRKLLDAPGTFPQSIIDSVNVDLSWDIDENTIYFFSAPHSVGMLRCDDDQIDLSHNPIKMACTITGRRKAQLEVFPQAYTLLRIGEEPVTETSAPQRKWWQRAWDWLKNLGVNLKRGWEAWKKIHSF